MPELRRDRAADVRLIVGSPGSGKTWYAKRAIEAPVPRDARGVRVVVWDYKDDFFTLPKVTLDELRLTILWLARPVRYVPRRDDTLDAQFATWCRIVWAAQEADPSWDCRAVVDEAHKVLRAGVRIEPWENIVEVGRAYGVSAFICSTRPAYVDLGVRGAANFVRCGRLGEEDDARAMGRRLGVPYGEIQRLPDKWAYEFDGRKTTLYKPGGKGK